MTTIAIYDPTCLFKDLFDDDIDDDDDDYFDDDDEFRHGSPKRDGTAEFVHSMWLMDMIKKRRGD